MSIPLPTSGTNVQRWMLIKLVQFPATDRAGVIRLPEHALILDYSHSATTAKTTIKYLNPYFR